jgi:hypothetical protein
MKILNSFIFIFLITTPVFSQNGKSTKRGIAYGYHSAADMAAISDGLCWWYNWSYQPESGIATTYQNYNMDFVPMTWNNGFNEAGLKAYYKSHPNARYLLAFNEPNFTGQANMKPSQVAAAWPRLEAIADTYNLKIVGPAVNWCGGAGSCVSEGGITFTNPIAFLDTFFSECPDCRVDYIAVHNYMCYSGALSSDLNAYKKYGKKIWLTEYACWDQQNITLAMQKSYMKGSIDYLENDTMIFRYAWFTGNRSGAYPYLDIYAPQSGKLSELGQFYVSYKAFVPDTSWYTPVPARIEAEHYSTMFGISTETVTDFDGVDDVGWIDIGDWLEYNIDVPSAASYYVYLRIASAASTSIIFKLDGQNTDTLAVPSSGGYQSWKTLLKQIDLPAGKHKLRVFAQKANFNLNWIRISDHINTAPTIDAGAEQIITSPENTASLVAVGNDIDGDVLQYKWTKLSGPGTAVISSPIQSETNVTGLVKGKYIFSVIISDGTVTASDFVTVNVVFATGQPENVTESEIIYPNPVERFLYLQNSGFAGQTDVLISDPSGRTVLSKSFSDATEKIELDLSDIKNGFYIVRIKSQSGNSVHSIIKM